MVFCLRVRCTKRNDFSRRAVSTESNRIVRSYLGWFLSRDIRITAFFVTYRALQKDARLTSRLFVIPAFAAIQSQLDNKPAAKDNKANHNQI